MITLRVWFVMIVLAMTLAAGRMWNAIVTSPRIVPTTAASATVIGLPEGLEPTAASTQLDLYGNEVEEAVGDYRIDPAGDVYERHSPETEVAHLPPPVI